MRPKSRKRLSCWIIVHEATDRGHRLPFPPAEVELKIESEIPIEIGWQGHVFQHLDLVVKTEAGVVVSRFRYGLMLLQYGNPSSTLTLNPGEVFKAHVSLMGSVEHDSIKPGKYQAYAVFDCGDIQAISDLVTFEVAGY